MELLIGCGSRRDRLIHLGPKQPWENLVTLDLFPSHRPDVVADLEEGIPFRDSCFSEVHAYEVLEHLGSQGDYHAFFRHFTEIWRVLEHGGFLFATVPSTRSPWLWGDPSHRRAVTLESLTFLSQEEYEKQIGVTAMSDFRSVYSADLRLVWHDDDGIYLAFVMRAVKP